MASSTSAWTEPAAPYDVLVVGAGPGGSAAAALLARAGYRVAAVDRAAFPRDKACSEYMSPEAVRLLDRLGVVGAVEARGRGAAGRHRGDRRARQPAAGPLRPWRGPAPFRPTGLSVAAPHPRPRPGRRGARGRGRGARADGGRGAALRPGRRRRRRGARRRRDAPEPPRPAHRRGRRAPLDRRSAPRAAGATDPLRRIAFVAHVDGVAGHGRLGRDARRPRGLRRAQPDRRRPGERGAGRARGRGAPRPAGRAEGFFLERTARLSGAATLG